jgi:hypothetical protein
MSTDQLSTERPTDPILLRAVQAAEAAIRKEKWSIREYVGDDQYRYFRRHAKGRMPYRFVHVGIGRPDTFGAEILVELEYTPKGLHAIYGIKADGTAMLYAN